MTGEGTPTPPEDRRVIPIPGDESRIVEMPKEQWTPAMHRRAAEAQGNPVIGPHGPENRPQFVHPGQIGQENVPVHESDSRQYDDLVDPTKPNPSGSVEDAAVRPLGDTTPPRTIDRPGYWQPPIEDQIERAAAADGQYDLTQQDKYFPPGQ